MNQSFSSKDSIFTKRILTCPRCNKRFQKESGKLFTCKTCGDTSNTCGHICCPHCGYSWKFE